MTAVGFFSNQLGLRGTDNAMYDYADFNETLLGNRSLVISHPLEEVGESEDRTRESYARFERRFKVHYISKANLQEQLDAAVTSLGIQVLYVAKWGLAEGAWCAACPVLVHAVFAMPEPHGACYVGISEYVALRAGLAKDRSIPYIVRLADDRADLRRELGIPAAAVVYGRHGGHDTFNLPAAWEAVHAAALARPDLYFLFLNTKPFCPPLHNIIHLPASADPVRKRRFLNTCDAMLHARDCGETFGIAPAEFAVLNKPILTCPCGDLAHLYMLGAEARVWCDAPQLRDLLLHGPPARAGRTKYHDCSPEAIMRGSFARCLQECLGVETTVMEQVR